MTYNIPIPYPTLHWRQPQTHNKQQHPGTRHMKFCISASQVLPLWQLKKWFKAPFQLNGRPSEHRILRNTLLRATHECCHPSPSQTHMIRHTHNALENAQRVLTALFTMTTTILVLNSQLCPWLMVRRQEPWYSTQQPH